MTLTSQVAAALISRNILGFLLKTSETSKIIKHTVKLLLHHATFPPLSSFKTPLNSKRCASHKPALAPPAGTCVNWRVFFFHAVIKHLDPHPRHPPLGGQEHTSNAVLHAGTHWVGSPSSMCCLSQDPAVEGRGGRLMLTFAEFICSCEIFCMAALSAFA